MTIEAHNVIEDGKVVTAGICTIWLQYSQLLNETLTLFISLCTAIYVGRKAVKAVIETIKDIKALRNKKKGK